MTVLLVFLAGTSLGATAGWWAHKARHEVTETRALDAHFLATKADVFAESGERLYDEKAALEARFTPELTRLQDKNLRYRALLLRGRSTT